MISEILENTFFAFWYSYGDLFKIYLAGLILFGVIFSLLYQMTKR